jgi:proteasome lid subunit RPN8/RPN11
MFAGIAANALRAATGTSEASVIIWRSQPSGAVDVHRGTAYPQTAWKLGEWTLIADQGILDIIGQLRAEKLPKETGGVLLGWFDNEEKIVRIVDTIASPPDSKEWPTLYIRGCKGLPKLVDVATAASGEQVHYVGEWHSHPDGHTCDPSSDDMKVFTWLTEHMDEHGLPAVMMIAGEAAQFAAFIGRMGPRITASVNKKATA